MKHKHTRAPWVHDDSFNIPVGDGDIPEHCPTTWISRPTDGIRITFATSAKRETILADTRLIEAAPDLLEAAEAILTFAENPNVSAVELRRSIVESKGFRAAIRKATGEID